MNAECANAKRNGICAKKRGGGGVLIEQETLKSRG